MNLTKNEWKGILLDLLEVKSGQELIDMATQIEHHLEKTNSPNNRIEITNEELGDAKQILAFSIYDNLDDSIVKLEKNGSFNILGKSINTTELSARKFNESVRSLSFLLADENEKSNQMVSFNRVFMHKNGTLINNHIDLLGGKYTLKMGLDSWYIDDHGKSIPDNKKSASEIFIINMTDAHMQAIDHSNEMNERVYEQESYAADNSKMQSFSTEMY